MASTPPPTPSPTANPPATCPTSTNQTPDRIDPANRIDPINRIGQIAGGSIDTRTCARCKRTFTGNAIHANFYSYALPPSPAAPDHTNHHGELIRYHSWCKSCCRDAGAERYRQRKAALQDYSLTIDKNRVPTDAAHLLDLVSKGITPTGYKKCTGCGKTLPATTTWFYRTRYGLKGPILSSSCRQCTILRARKRYHRLTTTTPATESIPTTSPQPAPPLPPLPPDTTGALY